MGMIMMVLQGICCGYRYSRLAGLAKFRCINFPRPIGTLPAASVVDSSSRPGASPLFLELKNGHPKDKYLTFDEGLHKYAFDEKPLSQSVTSVVSNYFEKFIPDKAVELMMNGKNWPRPQYCDEDGMPFTKERILAQWESVGELARSQGTLMHSDIEQYLNNVEVTTVIPEFEQFLQFKKEVMESRGVTPYRTEWRVAAPDLSLGGSVDFVGRKADGSYVLMDWKRSKNLTKNMYSSYGKKCLKPVSNLPDCEGSKYGLQLNMYRYILGRYYDVHISSMTLASFHPHLDRYFTAEIPVMEKEVLAIVDDIAMKQRQQQARTVF